MFRKIIKIFLKLLFVLVLSNIILIILFRFLPIPSSSFMIQKGISNLFAKENLYIEYNWTSKFKISNSIKLAVLAAEDQKFFDHFGFDFDSIYDAIDQNKNRKNIRGASTITQQTAKNLFLWSGKSFIRKGLEAYFTVLLELFWTKERILEVYINIAEFGENVYGVQAASKKYFGKNANQLSFNDSAKLAAVLPNPKRFNVNSPSQYLQNRASWIQKQMNQLGEQILETY